MIKNENTYCTVQHKIVRELGAWEAVVYGTIANLLRKTDGIGEVTNQTIMDLCGINNKMSLKRYLDKLIESGYIEKRSGDGRGNISIYYITKKGNNLLPFSEKKGNKNDIERVTKMNEKGNNLLPINKGINKEINKEYLSSSFEVQTPKDDEREEEEKILKDKLNNSDPQELEAKALADVKQLFNETVSEEARASFSEFWSLFNPSSDQQCKYKVALQEWNNTPENCRHAAISLMQRGAKPTNPNPYFFLQHFRETKYFLNEREQYDCYKTGIQLCRVRYKDQQRVMAAVYADAFRMEIIDDDWGKRFIDQK